MIGYNDVALLAAEKAHVSHLVQYGNAGGLYNYKLSKKKTCVLEQQRKVAEGGMIFVINVGDDKKGVVEIFDIDWINRKCWVNVYIANRAESVPKWGSAIINSVSGYVFDTLGIHKITTEVVIDDVVMLSLYKKHGFRPEVRKRQHYFTNGSYHTVLEMSLLESEYEVVK